MSKTWSCLQGKMTGPCSQLCLVCRQQWAPVGAFRQVDVALLFSPDVLTVCTLVVVVAVVFFFSIIVSQNSLGWKRLLKSLSPSILLALPSLPLNPVPRCHIYRAFKPFQGWWLYHPGQPVPVFDYSFSEEISSNIQPKCPLVQLDAISSHPSLATWKKRLPHPLPQGSQWPPLR